LIEKVNCQGGGFDQSVLKVY